MVFIFNVPFNEGWLVKKSLQTFYGLGPHGAARILAKLYIHPLAKVESLKHPTILALNEELSKMTLENDLRKEVWANIRRLRDMGTYRGRRHAMRLPVRGQRTRNNIVNAKRFNKVVNELGN